VIAMNDRQRAPGHDQATVWAAEFDFLIKSGSPQVDSLTISKGPSRVDFGRPV
jgi:hypothetical protein